MSDVMHGPSVLVGDRTKRKTYLIAFIDDATRVIPYAAFALAENTREFLPVLKQAVLRRGLVQRLYVDNGAHYRSQHLALVCAKLGIALIHARPYRPQGKGKIERWFKTVRAQLLTRLTEDDTRSLEALNRRLHAWIETEKCCMQHFSVYVFSHLMLRQPRRNRSEHPGPQAGGHITFLPRIVRAPLGNR